MKKFILPLIIILFLSSCNTWKFVGEYDHDVDFSKYKTFGLLNWERHNDDQVSQQTKKFILMSIKHEMEVRGYVYQENNADLQVSVFIIISEETSYSAYASQMAGYGGYGSVGVGIGVGSGGASVGVVGYGMAGGLYPYTAVKHDYNVGTFVIDLMDPKLKRIVWQGLAQGRVEHEEAKEKNVKKDVARLFNTLPVEKQKK
ncbi:MAG: DUF4136 domain-containing protein [Bacteroidota bacterium]